MKLGEDVGRMLARTGFNFLTYILHELLADRSDFLGEGSREHAHLLLVRG